jgi:hypothetical protein
MYRREEVKWAKIQKGQVKAKKYMGRADEWTPGLGLEALTKVDA